MPFGVFRALSQKTSDAWEALYWDATDIKCVECGQVLEHQHVVHLCYEHKEMYIGQCTCRVHWDNPLDFFKLVFYPPIWECQECYRKRLRIPIQDWENDGYVRQLNYNTN